MSDVFAVFKITDHAAHAFARHACLHIMCWPADHHVVGRNPLNSMTELFQGLSYI